MAERGSEINQNLPVLDPGLARSLLEGNRDPEDIKDVQKSLGLKPTGTFDLKTKQAIEKRLKPVLNESKSSEDLLKNNIKKLLGGKETKRGIETMN